MSVFGEGAPSKSASRQERAFAGALYVLGCLAYGFLASVAALKLASISETTISASFALCAVSVVGSVVVGSPLGSRFSRLIPLWSLVLLGAVSVIATTCWAAFVVFSIRFGSAGSIPLLDTWAGQFALFISWTFPAWSVTVGVLLLASTRKLRLGAQRIAFFACAGFGLVLVALASFTLVMNGT